MTALEQQQKDFDRICYIHGIEINDQGKTISISQKVADIMEKHPETLLYRLKQHYSELNYSFQIIIT